MNIILDQNVVLERFFFGGDDISISLSPKRKKKLQAQGPTQSSAKVYIALALGPIHKYEEYKMSILP